VDDSPATRNRTVIVPADAAGERLDRFLAGHVGSRAAAERAVDAGVRVDGVVRPKSHRLEGGELVELPEPEQQPAPAPAPPPRVRWQDEHLAVIDKPAGVVVHAGAGRAGGTLVDALDGIAAGGEPGRAGIVHRLDRDTSGLLVVARSEEAHRRLSTLVRRRKLERTYLALVRGRPRSRQGRIEAAIGRDRHDPTRFSLDTDTPREAVTHFEVERLVAGHALLRVRLETGRTHQIRVHLSAIDLPVVGDTVYGVPDPTLGRQFLHATRLAFAHPFTGERVDVHSPLPPDLQSYLDRLSDEGSTPSSSGYGSAS
jgi:23S rRNA pseudouridine1911/1915/1917 synthase